MTRFLASVLALMLILASGSAAELRRTSANLPYRFPQVDAFGNVWMLYNGGRLMQQGNMPFCSDSANLTVNGQGIQPQNQSVALENGEAVIENLRLGQFIVTRRFAQQDDGTMRVTDIFRNSRGQDAVANAMISFNVNFGVQSSRMLSDAKHADRTLGTVITDGQNRSLLSVFAGKDSKITPTINAPQNNNVVQATFELKVPANKEVAIVHFHQTLPTAEHADKAFAALREPRAIAPLSPELRRIVANYASAAGAFDDLEILRGTSTDVLELTNGDQLRGDLLNTAWEIEASFGKVQIPAGDVLGMIVPGGLMPRQLILTRDGEIIGGKLTAPAVELQIASGQKVSIPLPQVARFGVRAGTAEPTTAPESRPMVQLRTGDRLAIVMPVEPLQVVTRFGSLSLSADSIAGIDLQPDQSPVHLISLKDGSRFSGLIASDSLSFSLARGGNLTVPTAVVRKVTFAPANENDDINAMRLTGDDTLAAVLPESLALHTTYGEVAIKGCGGETHHTCEGHGRRYPGPALG